MTEFMNKANCEVTCIQLPLSDFLQQRRIKSTLLHLKPWQAYGRHVRAAHPQISENIALGSSESSLKRNLKLSFTLTKFDDRQMLKLLTNECAAEVILIGCTAVCLVCHLENTPVKP